DNHDDQDTDNNGDDFVHPKLSIHEEEAKDEESFDPIVQTPGKSNDEGNDDASLGMNVGSEEGHDAEDDEELYRDVNINLEVSSQFVTSMFNPSPDAGIDSLFETTPRVDVQASTIVAPLILTALTLPPPTTPIIFQTLEANFSEFMQTNQFARAVSSIPEIVERDMDQRMNEAVKMELKKILIEKMKGNKSIQRSDEQRNLYKALVETYESDKIILDTYEETVTLKRRLDDDADKDEEPSAGPDRGSKRRREGKEPESASAPTEIVTRSVGRSTQGSQSR
nr:hypothetical protein [Tanacetum cinerariifolium]